MKHLSIWPSKLLTLLFSLLTTGFTQAQAPAWQTLMSTSQGLGNTSIISDVVTNANGDVYLTGTFSGTVSFGPTPLLSSNGQLFVAKWRPASNSFAWVQQASASVIEKAPLLAVNGSNVYIAGTFMGAATFDAITLPSSGAREGYVAKLSDAGNSASWTWGQLIGGAADDKIEALLTQGADIYLAGSFGSSTLVMGSTSLVNAGTNSTDAFVAKLTDAGGSASFVWAQRGGGTADEQIDALALNGSALYAAGSYIGTASRFGTLVLPATSSNDIFVVKLNDAGTSSSFAWMQAAGGANFDEPAALAVSSSGIYLAGTFQGSAASFGAATLAAAGGTNSDIFLAKLTDSGTAGSFVWTRRAGGTSPDVLTDMVIKGTSVYLAGMVSSATADFGNTTFSSRGGSDIFLAKVVDAGTNGAFVWTQQAGGTGGDRVDALVVQGTSIYVAGSVLPVADFGSLTVASPVTPAGNAPTYVAYLASLTDLTLSAVGVAGPELAIDVYPNPAHAAAFVYLPPVAGSVTIKLTDALGRTVQTCFATASRQELNLAALAPGVYALRVQTGEGTSVRRLVVE
jgi:hypothetical protein